MNMKPNLLYYSDFLLVLILFIYNYSKRQFGLTEYVGFFLFIPAFLLWFVSRMQLGKYFAVLPEAKGLITKGFYSKLRNPIYFFSAFAMLGAILPSGSLLQYGFLVTIICIQLFRSREEEKVLRKKFGQDYEKYKKSTWF